MRNLKKIMTYVVLIVASLISIFPLYWMIAASTNNSTDILGGKLLLGTNLLVNFQNLINNKHCLIKIRDFVFYHFERHITCGMFDCGICI